MHILGIFWLDGYPRTYIQLVEGFDDASMLRIVEGKLDRLTHDMSTLRMERIPISMQEHAVGVPSSWLRLLRNVSRVVLFYQKAVEKEAAAYEAEDPP